MAIHADDDGLTRVDPLLRPVVFDNKNPPSVPTFLVDGRVAGEWRYDDGRIELEPSERISRPALQELRTEGNRLAAFMNGGG